MGRRKYFIRGRASKLASCQIEVASTQVTFESLQVGLFLSVSTGTTSQPVELVLLVGERNGAKGYAVEGRKGLPLMLVGLSSCPGRLGS